MSRIYFLVFSLILFWNCKDNKPQRLPLKIESTTYLSYGAQFDVSEVYKSEEFTNIMVGLTDTIQVTMRGMVSDVCSKKGCWMTLPLSNGEELMVRFKDYGFFVPTDASGEAIVNGLAYVSETSLADLRHYAEDAGASSAEIEAITEPKITYSFMADGVLLAE
ncbi:MAG: DUF4920 domain-containing protein [Formosa sp.]|jgi:hypothetical protein|nr:DUF4920 domain-containing protein [Formosa sp.]|tara:strand:+ start:8075 stop:8563 length:489 start_codon:yes stop_codon:yes gene_type:complete